MKRNKYLLSGTTMIIIVILVQALCFAAEKVQMTGPYDSLRDYIAALEARGKILRVKEVDQDNYEGTALMFRLIDEFGADQAPAVLCYPSDRDLAR